MAYATTEDIEKRILRDLSEDEKAVCESLLDDAAVIIDSYNKDASDEAKLVVSCRMVIRAVGSGDDDVPVGATQGSMSAMGYSRSWAMSGGSTGELYINKLDKKLLGVGNSIGSYSPVQELAITEE